MHLIRPDLNGGNFENLTLSSQLGVISREIESSPERVVLIGSSLGAYISVLTAQKYEQIRKLVLLAPALDFVDRYFRNISPAEMSRWKVKGYLPLYHFAYEKEMPLGYGMVQDAEQYRTIEFTRPIDALLIHGIYDEIVPYTVSVEYLHRNPKAALLGFPSDHSLMNQLENIWRYVASFLAF